MIRSDVKSSYHNKKIKIIQNKTENKKIRPLIKTTNNRRKSK